MKILHVVGARPNFMKIAPLMHAIDSWSLDQFEQMLVHTGQHYDANMSRIFFEELDLPQPEINLGVGSGTHAWQTAEIMLRIEPVLKQFDPDWVIVPGDVNSTLAVALVCSKLGIRVAHVEAGLRSFDRSMPEEVNRVLTDHSSDLLLAPSIDAEQNLLREGIPGERIHFVGNLMIDTLARLLPKAEERWLPLRKSLGLSMPPLLVTLHRPSNVDDPATLRQIVEALNSLSKVVPIIFPVHPRTRSKLLDMHQHLVRQIILLEPLGYLDFLSLQTHAALVLTDSGGVQEETTYLGVPCLTARPNTERPITITQGTNRLVRSEREELIEAVTTIISDVQTSSASTLSPPDLWDGQTALRIVRILGRMT